MHAPTPAAGGSSPAAAAAAGQQQQTPSADGGEGSTARCATPQECATMVHAVEEAMKHAAECTPGSQTGGAHASSASHLAAWLSAEGVALPTPAAQDLAGLVEAAADNRRLRRQLEALRDAELELAAREAEETAASFGMLEEENLDLAARNSDLQQRIAELEALAEAAEAAAQAWQQQAEQQAQREAEQRAQQEQEPQTPQHLVKHGSSEGGMQERATSVLKRAADARRLSGLYEEEQQARLQQLDTAQGQLTAVKSACPGSTSSQQARLSAAEQEVAAAAEAARLAGGKLQAVLAEREAVQAELAAIRRQLEAQPLLAAQHAELYSKLLEAQQQMVQEKQQHERLTGSLLEHAGRLSHKYHGLADDYDALQHRYRQLSSANEHLAGQLQEAHEVLYELQAAVAATPAHKQRKQQHLQERVSGAEQAIRTLQEDKQLLQERLLQAQAFIACLQQRTAAAGAGAPQEEQQQQTPQAGTAAVAAPPGATPAAGAQEQHEFITPVKGRANALADGAASSVAAAAGMAAGSHTAATWPAAAAPVSPILAAAARSGAVGEQRVQLQQAAASHELQDVQQEQLGLRQEISRAKHVLADIAGQLRASIGSTASAAAAAAAATPGTAGSVSKPAAAQLSSGTKPAVTSSNSSSQALKAAAAVSAVRLSCSVARAASQAGDALAVTRTSNSHGSSRSASGSSSATAAAARDQAYARLQQLRQSAAAARSERAAATAATADDDDDISSGRPAGEFTFPQLGHSVQRPASVAALGSSRQESWGEAGSSVGAGQAGAADTQQAAGIGMQSAALAAMASAFPAGRGAGAGGSAATTASTGSRAGAQGGSLSLDQLIAEGESVSLEYGMTSSTQLQSPAEQGAFAFNASLPAQTPGSAASSAGGAGALAGPRQQQQPWLLDAYATPPAGATPGSLAAAAATPGDMGSAARGSSISGAAPPMGAAAAAPATPAGLERVASSSALPELLPEQAAAEDQAAAQAESPAVSAAKGTAAGGGSVAAAVTEIEARLATAAPTASGHMAISLALASALEQAAAASHGHHQQQQRHAGHDEAALATPVRGAVAGAASAAAAAATPPGTAEAGSSSGRALPPSPRSALKAAAAALLSSINPAGVAESATPPSGLAAAPAHLLSHLTPEWLRSLKRKCRQESEQLKELRQQLGLVTPADSVAPTPLSSGHQQPVAGGAADASPHVVEGASPGAAAAATPAGSIVTPAAADARDSVLGGASQGPALDVLGASSSSCPPGEPGGSAMSGQQLSSSRSGRLDKLRRRAIMAQAAAAAGGSGELSSPEPSILAAAAAPASAPGADAATVWAMVGGGRPGAPAQQLLARDESLDRSSSTGSLAEYMLLRQRSFRSEGGGQLSRTNSRAGALMAQARPEAPTPGSSFSDFNDLPRPALHAGVAGPSPASPDALLAGLQSSRRVARHLQAQLMQHLERAASLPVLPDAAAGSAAARAGPGVPASTRFASPAAALLSHDSAPANVMAAAAAAAAADPCSDSLTDDYEAADAAALQRDAVESAPPAEEAATPPPSARPLQQSSAWLAQQQLAADSPITPGAALNAGAESRLLSPTAQLELVFEEGSQQPGADEVGARSISSDSNRQQQRTHPEAGMTPASSCAVPLGLAAQPEPAADSVVGGLGSPVFTQSTAAATALAGQQGSSISTRQGGAAWPMSVTPASITCAPAPAASSAAGAASSARTSASAGGSSAVRASEGPSLSSWAAASGVRATPTTASSGTSSSTASASSGQQQHAASAQPTAQLPIALGDSPSTRGLQASSSSAVGGARAAAPAQSCELSSSLSSAVPSAHLSLGTSPGSVTAKAAGAAAGPDASGCSKRSSKPAASAATAAAPQPAESGSTTWSSAMFATPAAAVSGAVSGGERYYTGLPHSRQPVSTGASVQGHARAEGVAAASPAGDGVDEGEDTQLDSEVRSAAAGGSGGGLLLLASPACSEVSTAAGVSPCVAPVAPCLQQGASASPQATSQGGCGAATPTTTTTSAAAAARAGQASPTLSELGFVAASASADVALAKRIQLQQAAEQARAAGVPPAGSSAQGDLADLTFEQRLSLLCAGDDGDGGNEDDAGSAGGSSHLPHAAATQTSPYLAVGPGAAADLDGGRFRDAAVQFPTPAAAQATVSKTGGSDSPAQATVPRPCDLFASPVKGRDQE